MQYRANGAVLWCIIILCTVCTLQSSSSSWRGLDWDCPKCLQTGSSAVPLLFLHTGSRPDPQQFHSCSFIPVPDRILSSSTPVPSYRFQTGSSAVPLLFLHTGSRPDPQQFHSCSFIPVPDRILSSSTPVPSYRFLQQFRTGA